MTVTCDLGQQYLNATCSILTIIYTDAHFMLVTSFSFTGLKGTLTYLHITIILAVNALWVLHHISMSSYTTINPQFCMLSILFRSLDDANASAKVVIDTILMSFAYSVPGPYLVYCRFIGMYIYTSVFSHLNNVNHFGIGRFADVFTLYVTGIVNCPSAIEATTKWAH